MNTKNLLDQLLASGQSLLSQATRGGAPGGGIKVSDFSKGALAGGALGLLLGNKGIQRMGGGALKYGSAAALGALAYRTYTDWQRQQPQDSPQAPAATRTLDRLPSAEAEAHSRGILQALIAAAKADGHIDERERELVQRELANLADDVETRDWLQREIARPLDPAQIAAAATTPELASEMYLASLLAADSQSFMERAYLDELAKQLKLPAGLKEALEKDAAPKA
ncbi:uncharacterized membrane protein YebE (DUF533 family) [Panacagrimonas perspica]|uniref:Uncharacterized membrane protein YebE (DUF533 family) n=1 Tax=Panacagrimonas perspica TaxID=381431 RepID=A0A4R7NSX8_9GAMM|nr:tellurite resistance TerB family protein [Panacagrimonas perspica]TDU24175.1 uncharacterized membrane protein YebE (DUF533 family) [Panacagrimonas perspica]THD04587.1 hypothetical protein B1810_03990 [Panacagrimonas perspica]